MNLRDEGRQIQTHLRKLKSRLLVYSVRLYLAQRQDVEYDELTRKRLGAGYSYFRPCCRSEDQVRLPSQLAGGNVDDREAFRLGILRFYKLQRRDSISGFPRLTNEDIIARDDRIPVQELRGQLRLSSQATELLEKIPSKTARVIAGSACDQREV